MQIPGFMKALRPTNTRQAVRRAGTVAAGAAFALTAACGATVKHDGGKVIQAACDAAAHACTSSTGDRAALALNNNPYYRDLIVNLTCADGKTAPAKISGVRITDDAAATCAERAAEGDTDQLLRTAVGLQKTDPYGLNATGMKVTENEADSTVSKIEVTSRVDMSQASPSGYVPRQAITDIEVTERPLKQDSVVTVNSNTAGIATFAFNPKTKAFSRIDTGLPDGKAPVAQEQFSTTYGWTTPLDSSGHPRYGTTPGVRNFDPKTRQWVVGERVPTQADPQLPGAGSLQAGGPMGIG